MAVKPDIAVFTASVVTQSKKVKDAQDENSTRSNEMTGFLKKEGVLDKDLKTIGYSVQPQYQYYDVPPCFTQSCPARRPPEIVGYEIRHSLEIKVRDLEKVDDLLSGVVTRGANEVGSVFFKVDNEEKVKAEVRKKAIQNAQEKAETLVDDLGVRLSAIVGFSESGGGMPIFARSLESYGKDGGGFGGPTPQIEAGEQEIQVFVTVTYEFK